MRQRLEIIKTKNFRRSVTCYIKSWMAVHMWMGTHARPGSNPGASRQEARFCSLKLDIQKSIESSAPPPLVFDCSGMSEVTKPPLPTISFISSMKLGGTSLTVEVWPGSSTRTPRGAHPAGLRCSRYFSDHLKCINSIVVSLSGTDLNVNWRWRKRCGVHDGNFIWLELEIHNGWAVYLYTHVITLGEQGITFLIIKIVSTSVFQPFLFIYF